MLSGQSPSHKDFNRIDYVTIVASVILTVPVVTVLAVILCMKGQSSVKADIIR
jgi:hypothetical protein